MGEAPTIKEGLEDISLTLKDAPEKIRLECTITSGDPKAEIHWYKESKEIYGDKRRDISYKDQEAVCVINNVELSDAGWYRM